MNELEAAIINAARHAQNLYADMSGGDWLSHAPESFLQHEVARRIWKLGFFVYIDASGKKTQHAIGPKKGPRSKAHRKRFDISVLYKASDRLRAVIEIKRAWQLAPVCKDVGKISNSLSQANAAKSGYVLVYSEGKKKVTLEKRFERWNRKLKTNLVESLAVKPRNDDEGWCWGLSLFRIDAA